MSATSGIPKRRVRKRDIAIGSIIFGLILTLTYHVWIAPAYAFVSNFRLINSGSYEATHGRWDMVSIPDANKINAIHDAVLPTGKILLVAGSGNNLDNFKPPGRWPAGRGARPRRCGSKPPARWS